MKKNPNYALFDIAGVPYLLPFGQGVADFCRGVRLNGAGVFLWNALDETDSREQLLTRFLAHYQAEPADAAPLTQDMDAFLNTLSSLGVLCQDYEQLYVPDLSSLCFRIGALTLRLVGPADAVPPELLPFEVSGGADADLTVTLCSNTLPMLGNGALLLRNEELLVCEHPDLYALFFPKFPQLLECRLTKDGARANICHRPPYGSAFRTDLFHAIRFLYLYTAQKHGVFALHSASILYRGRAWLFSGHSGMGKSTHAALWHDLLQVPVLNGDLNLISLADGAPVVYGSPWCGTSGISDTGAYPLGGIILLQQHTADLCETLPDDTKALLTAQRLISPAWTAGQLADSLAFTERLSGQILICLLKCTKEPSAVSAIRSEIDDYCENFFP